MAAHSLQPQASGCKNIYYYVDMYYDTKIFLLYTKTKISNAHIIALLKIYYKFWYEPIQSQLPAIHFGYAIFCIAFAQKKYLISVCVN